MGILALNTYRKGLHAVYEASRGDISSGRSDTSESTGAPRTDRRWNGELNGLCHASAFCKSARDVAVLYEKATGWSLQEVYAVLVVPSSGDESTPPIHEASLAYRQKRLARLLIRLGRALDGGDWLRARNLALVAEDMVRDLTRPVEHTPITDVY